MGNFYTNVTLRGPDSDEVFEFLKWEGWTAWVTRASDDGATVVYERDCDEQDVEVLDELTARLAARFGRPALGALVHDDDVLVLRLFDGRSLVFDYDSTRFVHAGVGVLARAFDAESALTSLWLALHRPHLLTIFEHRRHRRVLKHLGLPDWPVALGYTYIEKGDVPGDLGPEGLRHTRR